MLVARNSHVMKSGKSQCPTKWQHTLLLFFSLAIHNVPNYTWWITTTGLHSFAVRYPCRRITSAYITPSWCSTTIQSFNFWSWGSVFWWYTSSFAYVRKYHNFASVIYIPSQLQSRPLRGRDRPDLSKRKKKCKTSFSESGVILRSDRCQDVVEKTSGSYQLY